MSELFIPDEFLTEKTNHFNTSREIVCQSHTWSKVWEKISDEQTNLISFLSNLSKLKGLNIVLAGAGSSAYIGDAVLSAWLENFSCSVQAIPTTDLVTHFKKRIPTKKPLLLISFARSGNSPESYAAIEIANSLYSQVYHLIITCNPDGRLAGFSKNENTYIFLLPSEAEDKSLAMTNSFTSMALAAILIARLQSSEAKDIERQVRLLSNYGYKIINDYQKILLKASQVDFDRIVFLGSGPLWGIAKESHLKVQELTNGRVIGKFDSFLGFRHGPKAILNNRTLIVFLLSGDPTTFKYERDLIRQIATHGIDLHTLSICESAFEEPGIDYRLNLNSETKLMEEFWAIACTLPSQIIGFYKSLFLKLDPDNPSPNGTISRVVEGVKIYNVDNGTTS